ncbi:hypothetical protein V8F20_002506 [Naviculisporaceae sp. PSN 640]
MIPWGACSSLHAVVQRAETLLSRADNACTALRRSQSTGSASLVQLHQALIDGRTYIQREYDHLSNRYGSDKAVQGDQTSRMEFFMICGSIEEGITKPLEELAQHLQHHGHQPGHFYTHCHYCHEYHHHHHHHHGHHHGYHHNGWLLFIGDSPARHHRPRHYNLLFEYDPRFQEMINKWEMIRDNISSTFDSLQDRLKDKKSDNGNSGGGSSSNKDKKNGTVAEAVHNIVEIAGRLDEDYHLLEDADERIRMIGRHPPRRSRSSSRSSSFSSLSIRECQTVGR